MKEYFKRKNVQKVISFAVYMMLTLILQNMLLARIRPLGVCPMVLPAAAVAVGMFQGGVFGAVFALVMGIFADMAFVENTIMFTVLFPVIAFFTGLVSKFFINKRFVGFMGISVFALLITAIVQSMRVVAADAWAPVMIPVIVLQTLWSVPVAALVYLPPAKWIK